MSPELTSEYFRGLSRSLLNGDLAPVLRALRDPLVLYSPDAVIALGDDDNIKRFLRIYRRGLMAEGVKGADAYVQDASRDRLGMECYLVTHTFLDRDGRFVGEEELRYFVRRIEGAPLIEMVEQVDPFVILDCGNASRTE